MECRKRLTAGMNGTKRYQQRFGDRLLYVRYRHDPEQQRRLTTVELIVDEAPMPPARGNIDKKLFPHPNQNVLVQINYNETELRSRPKVAGAKWVPELKLWKMPYRSAEKLGIKERIRDEEVSSNGN